MDQASLNAFENQTQSVFQSAFPDEVTLPDGNTYPAGVTFGEMTVELEAGGLRQLQSISASVAKVGIEFFNFAIEGDELDLAPVEPVGLFRLKQRVQLTAAPGGVLPSAVASGVDYFIGEISSIYGGAQHVKISATPGGSSIDLGTDGEGSPFRLHRSAPEPPRGLRLKLGSSGGEFEIIEVSGAGASWIIKAARNSS